MKKNAVIAALTIGTTLACGAARAPQKETTPQSPPTAERTDADRSAVLGRPSARVTYGDDHVDVLLVRPKGCSRGASVEPCGESPVAGVPIGLTRTIGGTASLNATAVTTAECSTRTDERGVARFDRKTCSRIPDGGAVPPLPVIYGGYDSDGTLSKEAPGAAEGEPVELARIEPFKSWSGAAADKKEDDRIKGMSADDRRKLAREVVPKAIAATKEVLASKDDAAKREFLNACTMGHGAVPGFPDLRGLRREFCSNRANDDGEVCYQLGILLSEACGGRAVEWAGRDFKRSCALGYSASCQRPEIALGEQRSQTRDAQSAREKNAAAARAANWLPERADQLSKDCASSNQGACMAKNFAVGCAQGSRCANDACSVAAAGQCDSLGNAYLGRVPGVQKDDAIAKASWMEGCKLVPTRCTAYGIQLSAGSPVIPRDQNAAAEFFEVACKRNAEQCATIGVLYRDGRQVPQDREKAKAFFDRGCNGGSMVSCQLLKKLH